MVEELLPRSKYFPKSLFQDLDTKLLYNLLYNHLSYILLLYTFYFCNKLQHEIFLDLLYFIMIIFLLIIYQGFIFLDL